METVSILTTNEMLPGKDSDCGWKLKLKKRNRRDGMKETTYFVRWRGEVSGPYDISVLKDMLETGKVTKHHQISADRQSWVPIMSVLVEAPTQSIAGKEDTAFLKATPPPSVEIAQSMPVNDAAEMEKEDLNPSPEPTRHSLRLAKDSREPAPPSFPAISGSWYYLDGGQICGPVVFSVLQSMAAKGLLNPDSQILREGDQMWQPLHQVAGIAGGTINFMNQTADGTPGYGCDPMMPAGFWRRTLALVIDSAVLGCLCAVWLLLFYLFLHFCGLEKSEIDVLLKGFLSVISMLIIWIYFTCLESSSSITTFGKMAVDITVVDESGQPILYGRANARFWGKLLSSFLLIGFVMAAFTQKKQALHDLIAKTLVIRVNH